MSTPLIQSYDENYGALVRAPKTISPPGSSRGFTFGIERIAPSTEDLNQVKNRFTVGKSFNMRTVCTTSTPFKQLTRVSSLLPEPGQSDRMIDRPLNIMLSPQLTPTQFVTPFISKSRFGYTDPTARVLNIPPGDDLDIPTEYERDILATSPKSVFQYPTPQELEISSHYTYGIPPAVTPTTTRRRGLFTPTGIFRKRHFNLRKLFEPEDHGSPIRSSRPYLDKSISWEKSSDSPLGVTIRDKTFDGSPAMDRTFYASPPAAISRTFDASSPYGMDRTFTDYSPSYRERMFSESPAYEMDRTFSDYSPTTMVERFDAPPRNLMDRTFGGFSPTAVPRTSLTSPRYAMDRTFDASSPHPMDRTFEASSPHQMNRTFQASPPYAMNRTFETSPSFSMNRTFETSPPHPMDRTFGASSPHVMDRTFQASPPYAMNRTFEAPPPYFMNRTFETSSPQPMDRTFGASSPHVMDRTFQASPPYAINRTFETSPPYPMNRTFQTSSPHVMDTAFQGSPQYAMKGTFITPPSAIRRTFRRSPSPVLNQRFGRFATRTFGSRKLGDESFNVGCCTIT